MNNNKKKGFGSMSEKMKKEISSMGGRSQGKDTNPSNFANLPRKRLSELGRIGGSSQNKKTNPGNFANNIERARRAGRIGGKAKKHEDKK
jgi:general stress protein YciG